MITSRAEAKGRQPDVNEREIVVRVMKEEVKQELGNKQDPRETEEKQGPAQVSTNAQRANREGVHSA